MKKERKKENKERKGEPKESFRTELVDPKDPCSEL
jgi:hypothetical protein